MITTSMQNRFTAEAKNRFDLVGDIDYIGKSSPKAEETKANAIANNFRSYSHPRLRSIQLASLAAGRPGRAGLTPPYQPAAPSLSREPEEYRSPSRPRRPSPLRNLSRSAYSTSVNARYSSHQLETPCSGLTSNRKRGMPHAVSMPHTGFQALILCGPGIGLSTFTSVPSEFPKALLEIANRPMIWYVLDWCYHMGVVDITIITPPSSKDAIAAALAQNPHLTSLPSPTPDLLAPVGLEHTTPTAELLRLPEVQKAIESDFLLLPCDLVCDIAGETFLDSYLSSLGGLGGAGITDPSGFGVTRGDRLLLGGEKSGRRGGLSVWYNTSNREESVKKEECDFMCTAQLDPENRVSEKSSTLMDSSTMRKLVWTMPMSELWDQCEEDKDKSWKIRSSLMRKHGNVKCLTQYRDAHIYLLPHWIKKFAEVNEDFESFSEDLLGTWAKAEWRKASYRARSGVKDIFDSRTPSMVDRPENERPIEEELDLLSLSSTQTPSQSHTLSYTQQPRQKRTAQLASRVQAGPEDSILSDESSSPTTTTLETTPVVPPLLAYILPSAPSAPIVRRVDTTPLLLSVSLLLAKTPSLEESATNKNSTASPFAHAQKVASTATIAPRVTISRSDTLIGSNTTVATQCVVKNSVIGANVSLGANTRITGCVIMDGATVGEKCVLTGTVVGKKAKIGNRCQLTSCEVQDANALGDGMEGKGEKYLVGGLEDDFAEGSEDETEVDGEELTMGE